MITIYKTIFDSNNKFVFELIKILQLKNIYIQKRKIDETYNKQINNIKI